jgi:uncharacterized protein (TIGR02996 family)
VSKARPAAKPAKAATKKAAPAAKAATKKAPATAKAAKKMAAPTGNAATKPTTKPVVAKSPTTKPGAAASPTKKPATAKAQAAAKPSANKPGKTIATQPMSDRQRQFLADIISNPEDKKARLVYADLLQEQGDPRGEFIILQCTRAELPETDERAAALDAQIAELLKKHKKAWTAFAPAKGARWEYRRGFVEKLSIDASDLVDHAAVLFTAEPFEELNIWKIDESRHKAGKSRLAPILELPLGNIKRLSLARCKLSEDDVKALAYATTLGNVEVLDLSNGGSLEVPLAPLGAAVSLPKLRELKIGGTMCGDRAMVALAQAPSLRFTRLHANRTDLGRTGVAAIANATWAPGLEHLDLSSNEGLRDDALEELANSTRLTSLRSLYLEYTGLYERAAELILGSPVFARLEHLDVGSNALEYEKLEPVFGARLGRPSARTA